MSRVRELRLEANCEYEFYLCAEVWYLLSTIWRGVVLSRYLDISTPPHMASATRSRDQRQWVTLGGRWPAPGCGDSGHCITLGPAEAETLSGDTGARVGTMEPLTQDEQDLPFSSPSPSPVISQHSELCGKLPPVFPGSCFRL